MNKFPNVDHTFILCDPLREPDRASYLNHWLKTNNIDPSCYTMGLACYGSDLAIDDMLNAYNPWQNRKPVELQRDFNSYNLKPSEISLCMNWASVAKQAVNAKYNVVLILESDVIFGENFLTNMNIVIKQLDDNRLSWDFLSISGRADLRPKRKPDDTIHQWFGSPKYYHTRTTDAMVFQVKMLEKILTTFFPFAEVLDWELNYQLTLHNSTSLWLDPPIIRQGSGKEYPTLL